MDKKRAIFVGLLLTSSLVLSGCKKTKPSLPPQAQAPTITDSGTVPSSIPEVAMPQPAAEPQPAAPTPTVTKPKKKARGVIKSEAKKTPPPAAEAPATSSAENKSAENKIVVEGSKQDPAPPPLVAGPTNDQATRQRLNTAQLLSATEYNVNSITRSLSSDEQAIVQHIRGYVEQSRQATRDGDTERAYNLAVKAHLLSNSLKK